MLSRFLDPLRIEQVGWVGGRPKWRLHERLRYYAEPLGEIEIPADFDFDGASVPRRPLVWLAFGGRGMAASAIHDYGYQRHGLVVDGRFRPCTRAEIDALFYDALAADGWSGTDVISRWLMWAGVRAGGWAIWRRAPDRARDLNPVWSGSEGWPEGP